MTEQEKKLLQAKHRMEEAEARNRKKERSIRTRRLIQEGAILESVFPRAQHMELEAVYYNAKDPLAEVYTHDTNLKKRLRKYAAKYPELCKQTDDDGQGGLRFEIDKSRISIRLTAPYSDDRRKAASELAKKRGIHTRP